MSDQEQAAQLERLWPFIDWRAPIRMTTAWGSTDFACRMCIGLHGFNGRTPDDLEKHPKTREQYDQHMATRHKRSIQ